MPAPKNKLDRMLTASQIAEILSCSKRQAYEILAMFEVQGKAFRDGRMIRVSEKVFMQYVNEHTGPAKN